MWNRWWRSRREGKPQPLDVVMYTRQGCHLCEDAWATLEAARRRFPFELRKVDIDTDPVLLERFNLEVPVVEVNGQVYFRGRVNPVLLDRLLRGRTNPEE
jgi:glutaredoxin